jgi:uncharacterized membrane protein
MLELNNIVFLLGGNDLEMCEIRNLLTSKRIHYVDKKLKWDNAFLSQYNECLVKGKTYYGVELRKDIETDCRYISIDHHNERSTEKSALEQVADLLNVKLTREQELIAANDKGHIFAMKEMGASDKEVESIRKRDRVAQGAEEGDEEKAQTSIEKNLKIIKGVTTVRALTHFYSCITDRLYPYNKLLIYDNETLVYYGCYIEKLVRCFRSYIKAKKAFYRSNSTNGFFGLNKNSFSLEEIDKIKSRIIDTVMEEHSIHIFLCPFSVENVTDDKGKIEAFHQFLKESRWIKNKNEPGDDHEIINEYNASQYFHSYTQNAIFRYDEDFISNYTYGDVEGKKLIYELNLKKQIKKKFPEPLLYAEERGPDYKTEYEEVRYELNIQKISLTWYKKFGVCVFGFHVCNYDKSNPEDILLINQYARRLYPPFLDIESKENPLKGVQERIFPLSISIRNDSGIFVKEDYSKFWDDVNSNIDKSKKYLPAHVACFFNEDLEKYKFQTILNDRMFVISWYGAEQLTYNYRKRKKTYKEELKDKLYVLSDLCKVNDGGCEISGFGRDKNNKRVLNLSSSAGSYGYESNDFWYQYVFIDPYSPSCTDSIMKSKMIEEHTYSRWVEYSTLYGISRYSFVGLTQPANELGKFYPNALFLIDHMRTLYYYMVSHVLAQRAIIIQFYTRIAAIDIEEEIEFSEIESIYRDYKIFVNKMQNIEISSEDQGIELYDMLMEHTRVKIMAQDLEKRIQEMFKLQDMVSNNRRNRRMSTITVMSSLFAIFSLFFGLMNSHYFKDFIPAELKNMTSGTLNFGFLYTVLGLAIVSVLAVTTVFYWKNKNWRKIRWIYLISAICSAILFLLFFVYKMNLSIITGMVLLLVIIFILSFSHKKT